MCVITIIIPLLTDKKNFPLREVLTLVGEEGISKHIPASHARSKLLRVLLVIEPSAHYARLIRILAQSFTNQQNNLLTEVILLVGEEGLEPSRL